MVWSAQAADIGIPAPRMSWFTDMYADQARHKPCKSLLRAAQEGSLTVGIDVQPFCIPCMSLKNILQNLTLQNLTHASGSC